MALEEITQAVLEAARTEAEHILKAAKKAADEKLDAARKAAEERARAEAAEKEILSALRMRGRCLRCRPLWPSSGCSYFK